MTELSYTYENEDKTSWGEGPWVDEPDKLQWTDEATGLPCLIVRNQMGALCGYVGVEEGHPAFGRHYDDVPAEVHGGLTFSDVCQEPPEVPCPDCGGDGWLSDVRECSWCGTTGLVRVSREACEAHLICHIPEPGKSDRVWWLGFDCCHAQDYSPKMEAQFRSIRPPLETAFRGVYDHMEALSRALTGPWQEVYKTVGYVKNECRQLARQLAAMA